MKKLIISCLVFAFPFFVFGQAANVGIIQGIWFSQDEYFVGDTIRIYTAVQNNTGNDVEGTVDFFDNGVLLGTKNFTALDRRIIELLIDTEATEGTHEFSVVITELNKNEPGSSRETITPRVITSEQTLVVRKPIVPSEPDKFTDEDKTLFEKFLELILGENTETTSESSANDESDREEESVPTPPVLENLETSYPVLQKVTRPVNALQNTVVTSVRHEQEKVREGRSEQMRERVQETGNSEGASDANTSQKKGFSFWLASIYLGLLKLIEWMFSSLIITLLLSFGSMYLILKILFKIFSRRS